MLLLQLLQIIILRCVWIVWLDSNGTACLDHILLFEYYVMNNGVCQVSTVLVRRSVYAIVTGHQLF
jgi:hypothetical protein